MCLGLVVVVVLVVASDLTDRYDVSETLEIVLRREGANEGASVGAVE